MEVLYHIWYNHFRVLYNDKEYDMQIENYDNEDIKDIKVKRIIVEYCYNGIWHMLVEIW